MPFASSSGPMAQITAYIKYKIPAVKILNYILGRVIILSNKYLFLTCKLALVVIMTPCLLFAISKSILWGGGGGKTSMTG